MSKELFVKAEEVARELGISKPYAYKLVREMNEELKEKAPMQWVQRMNNIRSQAEEVIMTELIYK